ncbi:MAG: NHL repeat-containing protein [Candidatus Cybelea sp.]
MKTHLPLSALFLAVPALTGCGAPVLTPSPSSATSIAKSDAAFRFGERSRHGWLTPRARSGKRLLYVSDSANSVVDVFDAKGHRQSPIGQITDGINQPTGLTTDRSGNLYVANSEVPSGYSITVYPPGSTTPSKTYTKGLSEPVGIVVQGNGRLYVANFDGYDVTEYPKGSTTPDQTISFQTLEGNDPYALTLDASNDLFVAALGYPLAQAYELSRNAYTPQDLGINSIQVMHGIAVDKLGNVLIVNQGSRAIDVFSPGATSPSKIITKGLEQPALISLNKRQDKLYAADDGVSGNGTVRVFSYPVGKLIDTITFPQFAAPFGVALSPR